VLNNELYGAIIGENPNRRSLPKAKMRMKGDAVIPFELGIETFWAFWGDEPIVTNNPLLFTASSGTGKLFEFDKVILILLDQFKNILTSSQTLVVRDGLVGRRAVVIPRLFTLV